MHGGNEPGLELRRRKEDAAWRLESALRDAQAARSSGNLAEVRRALARMGKKEQAAEFYRKAGGNGKSTQGKFAQKKAEAVKNK